MANYTEVLTEQEINRIISNLPEGSNAKDVLDILGFYGECKLIFDAVISGDIDVIGAGENGLAYRSSNKAKRLLH